jgi:hypothetical protein
MSFCDAPDLVLTFEVRSIAVTARTCQQHTVCNTQPQCSIRTSHPTTSQSLQGHGISDGPSPLVVKSVERVVGGVLRLDISSV